MFKLDVLHLPIQENVMALWLHCNVEIVVSNPCLSSEIKRSNK